MEKLTYSIVYDNDMKQCAIDLQTFVSNITGYKCMIFENGKAPSNVTDIDKSYVIYIGEKSAKYMQYTNQFEKYGIQMGWLGTNAWIRLVKEGDGSFAEWLNKGDISFISDNEEEISKNAKRYNHFCTLYYELYKECKLRGDDDIDHSYSKTEAIDKMIKDFQFIRLKYIDLLISPWGLIKSFFGNSKAYKRVTRFAGMYFYKNYLKPFLNEEKTDSLNNG